MLLYLAILRYAAVSAAAPASRNDESKLLLFFKNNFILIF